MRRAEIMKNIILYLFMPEDTTEVGGKDSLGANPELSCRLYWLGPLKTIFWVVVAIFGPVFLVTLLA